jgi:hypothetical protein
MDMYRYGVEALMIHNKQHFATYTVTPSATMEPNSIEPLASRRRSLRKLIIVAQNLIAVIFHDCATPL